MSKEPESSITSATEKKEMAVFDELSSTPPRQVSLDSEVAFERKSRIKLLQDESKDSFILEDLSNAANMAKKSE